MKKPLALVAISTLITLIPTTAFADKDGQFPPDFEKRTPAELELREQMKNPKTPPIKYWDQVAICETNSNWQDRGNWAGGVGIARSTWVGYGGRDFARTPDKATRVEQIVIANRIAVFGYQTKNLYMTFEDRQKRKPFFRPPAGFFGWGCIKGRDALHPHKWVRKAGKTKP